ncbi:MAG: SRPBCC domain-containing protein [Planctomycetota bacterium]
MTEQATSASQAHASVRDLLVEIAIEAPRERVWKALVEETSLWWHRDFYTAPDPTGFAIEPKLGGWMFESWGEGNGLIWGTVGGLRAPSFLQVVGDTSKEWGGPNRNVMTWRLDEKEGSPGTTVLRLEHSIFGHVSDGTAASLEAGWLQLFGDCLKPFAETGERPAEAGPAGPAVRG